MRFGSHVIAVVRADELQLINPQLFDVRRGGYRSQTEYLRNKRRDRRRRRLPPKKSGCKNFVDFAGAMGRQIDELP